MFYGYYKHLIIFSLYLFSYDYQTGEWMNNRFTYLVVMEPDAPHQTALLKAVELACKTNAIIEFFACGYLTDKEINQFQSRQDAKRSTINALTDWCSEQVKTLVSHKGISTHIQPPHIEWNDQCLKAVCYRAREIDANMIITTNNHDHSDMQGLLRYSPCPVLLAHSSNSSITGNVLAALDTHKKSDANDALNNAILAAALNLAEDTDSNVHLVSAIDQKEAIAAHLGFEYLEDIESEQTLIASRFELPKNQVHIQLGNPQSIIQSCVEAVDADTLVIGTNTRKGIAGLFLGNTAEKLLSQLLCDVLIVN